jgi:hypothetical protein
LFSAIRFGNNSSNGLPAAGDDDGFAALDLVEQAGKMSFGFGSLNYARHARSNWSDRAAVVKCQLTLGPR